MAPIRADVLLAGIAGAHSRRARGASFIQLARAPWFAKKPFVLRNAPYTIVAPHMGQVEQRIALAETAKVAHEQGQINIEGLPGAAGFVKITLKDKKRPHRMEPAKYPSRIQRTYHTYDELLKILRQYEESLAKRTAPRVAPPVTLR
jgi:hypothetical protein